MAAPCQLFADIMLVLDRSGSLKNCFWSGASGQMDCRNNPELAHNEMYYFARDLVSEPISFLARR